MEFENKPFGVYARTDDANRIVAINSSAFLKDTEGWTLIDEGYGDRFHHAQGNYLPGPLMDERGILRYKLENGKPVERTQEEMDADYVPPIPQPSPDARITALEQTLAAYEAAYAEGVNEA